MPPNTAIETIEDTPVTGFAEEPEGAPTPKFVVRVDTFPLVAAIILAVPLVADSMILDKFEKSHAIVNC